jgi:hypothetical protein
LPILEDLDNLEITIKNILKTGYYSLLSNQIEKSSKGEAKLGISFEPSEKVLVLNKKFVNYCDFLDYLWTSFEGKIRHIYKGTFISCTFKLFKIQYQ